MLIGLILLAAGLALVIWGAERFTDGAVRTAIGFGVSTFYVGAVVSGFEPENLATGLAATAGNLPQVALGTVVWARAESTRRAAPESGDVAAHPRGCPDRVTTEG